METWFQFKNDEGKTALVPSSSIEVIIHKDGKYQIWILEGERYVVEDFSIISTSAQLITTLSAMKNE